MILSFACSQGTALHRIYKTLVVVFDDETTSFMEGAWSRLLNRPGETLLTALLERSTSSPISLSVRASLPPPLSFSLSLSLSCCGTLSRSLPSFLFPACFASGTFPCFIYLNRLWIAVPEIEVVALPAETVPSGFGSFVSASPGVINCHAPMVSIRNLATSRA